MGLYVLCLALGVAIFVFSCLTPPQPQPPQFQQSVVEISEIGKEIPVMRIRIISGHEFDLKLEDGRRILGRLTVTTPEGEEVRDKVIDFLNSPGVTHPAVVLLGKLDHAWSIELYLNVGEERVQLTSWLRENGLIWE